MHRSVPALAAALAIGSVLASAGPAAADAPLVPGSIQTIQLPVPTKWAEAVQVDVTVGRLIQAENGCLDPERKAKDDCLPDTGDLAGQLRATVALGLPDGASCTRGPSSDLDLFGTKTARLTAASAGVACLFLELAFPSDADDNLAQSDSMTVTLDLVARDLPASTDATKVPARTDGQAAEAPSLPSDRVPAAGGETASDGIVEEQVVDGSSAPSGVGADQVAAPDSGALPAVSVAPAGDEADLAPTGAVLDRLEAQVSVGDDGVVVQTAAADNSVQGQALAWGSLLLGAVALGWSAFVVVRRRRRKKVAA